MKFNLVNISNNLEIAQAFSKKMSVVSFRDYIQFMGSDLSMRAPHGFLCHAGMDPDYIAEMRELYPSAAILVACSSENAKDAANLLTIGAQDLIFTDLSSADTVERAVIRIAQFQREFSLKQTQDALRANIAAKGKLKVAAS